MAYKGLFKALRIFIPLVVIVLLAYFAIENISKHKFHPIIFSQKTMLAELWYRYKSEYIEKDSYRTVDKQRDNLTTSEGQSYTMLRAVWQDDKITFDKTWDWTQKNLLRSDGLFSWLYGPKNGKYAILTDQGGENSATDADTDIALALIFASIRWTNNDYLDAAKKIINQIWEIEIAEILGKYYVGSNNFEKFAKQKMIINPSYIAPYAYRIFAKYDLNKDHKWDQLVIDSYDFIDRASKDNLDKQSSNGLPPDWVYLDKETGSLKAISNPNLSTNFSYDALRLPWRLALDWQWYKNELTKEALQNYNFLTREWNQNAKLASQYSHDGQIINQSESLAMYGGVIGYFKVADKVNADIIYKQKLESLYNPNIQGWRSQPSYYDDNWVWFGMALYLEDLPNIADLNEA